MKKSILLSTALLVGVGAFAQTNNKARKGVLYPKARPSAAMDAVNTGAASSKKINPNNQIMASYDFASSRNGFGTLVEQTNPLWYDADLDLLAFTHRIAPVAEWPLTGLPGGSGASGYQQTTYSTDRGVTWPNDVVYYANDTYWGRYPSGVIANPAGNTDPAEAKFVATGPCTGSGSAWWANFMATVPANATGNITTNDQQAQPIVGGANASAWTYFSSYGTIANGSDVWTGARKYDGTNFMGTAVIKGVRGATVNDPYTWTQDSTTFNNWMINGGGDYYCSDPKIAFGPDGQTGYVLINGVLATATGNAARSLQPNVWKTTDGGATWNLVNQNYDWIANHPEILCNLLPTANDASWNTSGVEEPVPAFFDAHCSGMVVDANGVLHFVTTVVPAYSTHVDSLFYLYASADNTLDWGFSHMQYDDLDKPWIYDFTTDGNGTWNQKIVGKLFTRSIKDDDVVPDPAIWTTDGTAPMDYSNRVRASRSDDGTKVFYTWTDGDTTNIYNDGTNNYYHANSNPNFEYRAWDLTTGMFSPQMEISAFDAFEAGYYNTYTSHIAMPNATGYSVPAVYIVSQTGNTNATTAVDYYYIDNVTVDNSSYNATIASNVSLPGVVCTVGIKEEAGNAVNFVGQSFPNPTSGNATVKVSLNKAEDITLTVTNSIGQVVSTSKVKGVAGNNNLTIEAANLNSGIYFYSVEAGNSKVTRKMNIIK